MDYKGEITLQNYKLETVAGHFGIELKAHDALSDVKATREIIRKVLSI
jgi:exonuclease I